MNERSRTVPLLLLVNQDTIICTYIYKQTNDHTHTHVHKYNMIARTLMNLLNICRSICLSIYLIDGEVTIFSSFLHIYTLRLTPTKLCKWFCI